MFLLPTLNKDLSVEMPVFFGVKAWFDKLLFRIIGMIHLRLKTVGMGSLND